MRWAILLVAGCAYHPGSYRDYSGPWPGAHVELDCVELSVARGEGSVIQYAFGNRCDHRVLLDLASVRVTADGVLQRAFDPRGEIRPLMLPAHFLGREQIEYQPGGQQMCIDVGGINGSIARTERWLCP